MEHDVQLVISQILVKELVDNWILTFDYYNDAGELNISLQCHGILLEWVSRV